MRIKPSSTFYGAICAIALVLSASAVTLDQIRSTPNLTPARFAAYFSDFNFKFRAKVQSPEVFLASRSGDCDDYGTLAAAVLRERGYTPRLVTVRMRKVVHVVCYIEESGAYLDYNLRRKKTRLVKCDPSLEAIATSVANSYRANWSSASEFTYSQGVKRLVNTVLPGKSKSPGIFAAIK